MNNTLKITHIIQLLLDCGGGGAFLGSLGLGLDGLGKSGRGIMYKTPSNGYS
jgi:hypothetical protein